MRDEVDQLVRQLQLVLPSEEEFVPLSHRARVAVAIRCAQYAAPAARAFSRAHLGDDFVDAIDGTLNFATTFVTASNVRSRDIFERMQMAQIGKSAQWMRDAARGGDNEPDYLRSFAAYCGAWAADFAARAVESDVEGTQLAYEAMVYSAAAYCMFEQARFLLCGAGRATVVVASARVAQQVSRVFRVDFDIVLRQTDELFPLEIFGELGLRTDNFVSVQWRDAPVFVSSTFRDMQRERDYLRDIVFPGLAEALIPHRIRPVLVDLRWDLSNTAGCDESAEVAVLRHCLAEIDRCHPNFIVLLGGRYGSIPSREDLAAATRGADFKLGLETPSVTALEIMYILGKPGNPFFYFREGHAADGDAGHSVEHAGKLEELRQMIAESAPNQVRKYEAERTPEKSTSSLESLGIQVFDDLYDALQSVPPSTKSEIDRHELDDELSELGPREYCAVFLERHGAPRSDSIVSALLGKFAEADEAEWLGAALGLLVHLDEVDFLSADVADGKWEEKVESHALRLVEELPVDIAALYGLVLTRCERLTHSSPEFVRYVLAMLAVAPGGLRESDIASCLSRFGHSWSPLQYAALRRFVGRSLTHTECGRWRLRSTLFRDAVKMRVGDTTVVDAQARLGDHCAALPDTDPLRLNAIRHYLAAGRERVCETAQLLGGYSGDPAVPGARQPWLHDAAALVARELSKAESGRPNPVVNWLCQVIAATDVSDIVLFRLCQRVVSDVLPQAASGLLPVSRLEILRVCRNVLRRLMGRVPQSARRISILSLGGDKRFFEEVLRPIGADNLESAEERQLDRAKVYDLWIEVCRQIEAAIPGSHQL